MIFKQKEFKTITIKTKKLKVNYYSLISSFIKNLRRFKSFFYINLKINKMNNINLIHKFIILIIR